MWQNPVPQGNLLNEVWGSSATDVFVVGSGGIIIHSTDTLPGAPAGVTATAGKAQAKVSFKLPASYGGSAIISYTVTSAPAES